MRRTPVCRTSPDLKWRMKPSEHHQEADPAEDGYRAPHAQEGLAPAKPDVL